MEALTWSFRTLDPMFLAGPIVLCLLVCFGAFQIDYLLLIGRALANFALGRRDSFRRLGPGERPSALVVIPSLLRDQGDFDAITTTIESCAHNQYPSQLVIVAAVDGPNDAPKLFAALHDWVAAKNYAPNIFVYVTSTPTRLGKMMAVEAGVDFMRSLVARGVHPVFPTLYFSIDGDGTLSESALERLADRLTTPHPLTGNLRRIVSGKICIRPDLVWRGWRQFFTVKGQIYIQVAREFLVSNVARFNWKPTPQIGLPGALYCTWSQIIREAPRYMQFMQGLRFTDWVKWWLGFAPPKFSQSDAAALPEALTGASDDTCIAFLGSIASWQKGELSFDAPRTPLHALGRFLKGWFLERSHDYAPEARVYTYTPSTLKGLWVQRVRWNSSRVECAGRFWRAFWFHWEIGLPVGTQMVMLLHTVFDVGFYYILLPYYCFGGPKATLLFLLGYVGQTIAYALYTLMSLALERERRRYWRVLLCLPLASAYCIVINCFGCVVGVVRDIFLFGNATNFAPEWTLMKGRCERIAILFRVRRFFALCVRSALYGDVPLGWFWFGWAETRWTPSGYEGWTTKKRARAIVPWPSWSWMRRREVAATRPT